MTSTFNEFSSTVSVLVDDIGEDFVRVRFELTAKGGRLVGIREDGQQVRRNCYDGWVGKRWRETEDFLAHHCKKPFEVILDYD